MLMVMPKIIVISVIAALLVFYLLWRFFPKVGNVVNKEANKIKSEATKNEESKEENLNE